MEMLQRGGCYILYALCILHKLSLLWNVDNWSIASYTCSDSNCSKHQAVETISLLMKCGKAAQS